MVGVLGHVAPEVCEHWFRLSQERLPCKNISLVLDIVQKVLDPRCIKMGGTKDFFISIREGSKNFKPRKYGL